MSDNEHFSKLLNFAYFFLKFRPRTKKEIVDYLNKKSQKHHFNQKLVDEVVKQLEEENLINDNDFINWFVEQRNTSKPKSKFVLSQELVRLGINKESADDYFNKNQLNELELAKKALDKKTYLLKNLHNIKNYQKAFNFLLRRGFSYEICHQVLGRVHSY